MQPNPVDGNQSVISFTVDTPGKISIQITDRNGNVLQQRIAGYFAIGKYNYTISHLDALSTGSYYIVLSNNGQPQGKAEMMVVH